MSIQRSPFREWLANRIYKSPSAIAEFYSDPTGEVGERFPKWNLPDLYKMAESSWVLQEIYRVIIQETMRSGWTIEPKYGSKCGDCESEFEEKEIEVCPTCGSKDFKHPDPVQYAKANNLITSQNSNLQSFDNVMSSVIYHDLVADDWYISVGYAYVKSLKTYKPKEVFVEDPRNFKVLADDRGRIGDKTIWFCPICYPEKDSQVYKKPGPCPKCGIPLQNPAYEQRITNDITNLFTVNQVVHGSTYRVLPYLFGAPRMVSMWEILSTLRSMDAWFYDTYKNGKVAQIINFPGYTPDQVKGITTLISQKEQELKSVDPMYGDSRPERKLKSLVLGSAQPIGVYPIMPDPTQMSSLDFYKMMLQGIAGVYGVQLTFLSMSESGSGLGGGAMGAVRVEVQGRTIEKLQRDKEQVITNQLFPIFGITDWKFKFGPIEKKDELRDAQIAQIKANTALTYVNGGFTVNIDEDGDMEVSGEGERMAPVSPFGGGGEGDGEEEGEKKKPPKKRPSGKTPAKPKESGTSRREIQGTSTERTPYGPRGAEK
jgi:hypothetical protein